MLFDSDIGNIIIVEEVFCNEFDYVLLTLMKYPNMLDDTYYFLALQVYAIQNRNHQFSHFKYWYNKITHMNVFPQMCVKPSKMCPCQRL